MCSSAFVAAVTVCAGVIKCIIVTVMLEPYYCSIITIETRVIFTVICVIECTILAVKQIIPSRCIL